MPYQELGVALWFFIPALILGALAYLWLIVKAFGVHAGWGIAVLLFAPALLFVPMNWKAGRAPAALFVFACVLFVGGFVAGQFIETHDPRVKMVAGEKHVTLTRAKVDDYSMLKKHKDAAVLLMANSDVTDETLANLAGMDQLHKLDLSDTQITDDGLAVLAKLPKLRSLYVANTAVTDDGFRKHLFDAPQLIEIDLTGCKKIKSKTKRDWEAAGKAKDQKRKYVD
jgi:hypothetical protein